MIKLIIPFRALIVKRNFGDETANFGDETANGITQCKFLAQKTFAFLF